jgi:D-alanine-D-alanine ligase
MRIVVLHNQVAEDASVEESDVLVQCGAVAQALVESGHSVDRMDCTLDLDAAASRLRAKEPDVVFNLVESLGGTDRLMPLATMLLEGLEIPFTGSGTESILATINKPAAKSRLRCAGLPTPDWFVDAADHCDDGGSATWPLTGGRAIVKPIWEHASFGLSDDSITRVERMDALAATIRRRQQRTGRPHFAEAFVDGREFYLSLLATGGHQQSPQVLPPAEIDFSAFPADKPRIVGYRAKWDPQSFEYQQTPRSFEFPRSDRDLLDELRRLARACWTRFRLRGYARVDFRVDQDQRPWILEVNANPCLAPDAGYVAALQQAGIPVKTAIDRIVDDALAAGAGR